MASSGTKK